MNNYKYFRVDNKDSRQVENFLIKKKIEYKQYSGALKAVCDEEAIMMVEDLQEIYRNNQYMELANSLDDHIDNISEEIYNSEKELLEYYNFQRIFDKYLDNNNLKKDIDFEEDFVE